MQGSFAGDKNVLNLVMIAIPVSALESFVRYVSYISSQSVNMK